MYYVAALSTSTALGSSSLFNGAQTGTTYCTALSIDIKISQHSTVKTFQGINSDFKGCSKLISALLDIPEYSWAICDYSTLYLNNSRNLE